MPVRSNIRKRVFKQIKRKLGDQRARRLAIKASRFQLKLNPAPSVTFMQTTHVAGQGVYIHGDLIDIRSRVASIELVLNNGLTVPVDAGLRRFANKTIFSTAARNAENQPPGFIVWVEYSSVADVSDMVTLAPEYLRLNLRNGQRLDHSINATDACINPFSEVKKILKRIPAAAADKRSWFDTTYGPALQGIWSSRNADRPEVDVVRYNEHLAVEDPDVSLIVPIYGRYDFIEYQISLFINDPDLKNHEVVYVIDDPRLVDEIRQSCDTLSRIYDFPFRVLYLSRNMGYAGANNVGVHHARGNKILLLNSDVMPSKPGWLGETLNVLGDEVNNSITGMRLLYEDDTVQHDGMSFHASPFFEGLWTNIHPGKGMPQDLFNQAKSTVPCEAVTGACLLLTRENYLAVGGLDEDYILGDFEDSDLCMKARRSGMNIQMFPGVSLYHLERQSQSLLSTDRWKDELTYFNCWQHHQRWDATIESMKVTGTHG